MRRPILIAAVALLVCSPVAAQFKGGSPLPAGGRPGVVYGGTHPPAGPGARGPGWGNLSRFRFVFPLGFSGLPLSLGFGGPWGLGGPPVPVLILPPVVMNGVTPLAAPVPAGPDYDPPPAFKPGDHFVIRPKKALPLLPPPDAAPAPPPVPRPAGERPFAPAAFVVPEKPDPDPVKELDRLVKRGKEAFGGGEFGAASEHFNRAIKANPGAALPHFLKGQAAFASGRYTDAVAAIQAGLERDRTWPGSPFDPKEPYGPSPAAFNDHLAALRRAVAANPGEAALEFLLGYELWFIGEKVEAKKWFDLAEKRLPAPGPIALFK